MTPDEAREYLKNPKTPDHIADEARAVLHPIVTAEAAQAEDARRQAEADELLKFEFSATQHEVGGDV